MGMHERMPADETTPIGAVVDAVRPVFRPQRTVFFNERLILSCGETAFDEPKRVVAPLRTGLTVAVALTGGMTARIDDRPIIEITAPNVSLIMTNGIHRREQIFAGRSRLCYVLVHLAPSLIEETFGVDFATLIATGEAMTGIASPTFLARPADRTIRAIASKLMTCPIEDLARDIYLMGKSLELVAMTLGQHMPGAMRPHHGRPLAELERLQDARAILVSEYREPPTLPSLALRVGLNERKLNAGFRDLFGTTVHAFLQDYRLQRGHQMLSAGDMSVSEVAYRVGYAPAHFATIFRRRFGCSPSDLR